MGTTGGGDRRLALLGLPEDLDDLFFGKRGGLH